MSVQIKKKNQKSSDMSGVKIVLYTLAVPFLLLLLINLISWIPISLKGPAFGPFLIHLPLLIWSMIRLKKQAISAPLQLAWALTILLLPIAGPVTFLFLSPSEKK